VPDAGSKVRSLCKNGARKGPRREAGPVEVDGLPQRNTKRGEDNGFSAGPSPKGSTATQISCAFAYKAEERYKFCAGLVLISSPYSHTRSRPRPHQYFWWGLFHLAVLKFAVPRWDTK